MVVSRAKHAAPAPRTTLLDSFIIAASFALSAALLMGAWDGKLSFSGEPTNFGFLQNAATITPTYASPGGPVGTTPTGDTHWDKAAILAPTSRAQAYVEEVSPGAAKVAYVEAPCGLLPQEGYANGCVVSYRPGMIFLSSNGETLQDSELQALVIHELAHVYQYRLDGAFLNGNAAVLRLFPHESPAEPLADCMTEEKLGFQAHGYIDSCTPEQLLMAAQVWAEELPG